MKTKSSLLMILLSIFLTSAFSQEKSKKEIKEEQKLEKQKQIEAMVNTREFVFVGRTALPQGYKSVSLTSNPNYVKFHPDLIDSDMPFFGRAYSGIAYGGDSGLKFKGKPEKFTIEKKKNNYQIDANVNEGSENYRISLSVSFEGSSSLSIISNNRSTISYHGEISAPEKSKE